MRLLFAAWLALSPGLAAAQTAPRAVTLGAAPAGTVVAPVLAPGPATSLPNSTASLLLAPAPLSPVVSVAAAAPRAQEPSVAIAARAPSPKVRASGVASARKTAARAASVADAVAKEAARTADAPADASRGSSALQFSLLTGEAPVTAAKTELAAPEPGRGALSGLLAPSLARADAAPAAVEEAAPIPTPAPPQARSVRWMQAGTALWKFGIDPVTVAIPLLALQTLGGAIHVAWLVILYSTSQMVASSFASSLVDRKPANRVLAGAVAAQAAVVLGVLGLSAAGLLSPALLFPLYAALGAATGVLETARRVVPALVLGKDEQALKRYNGRLHIFYEIAGVGGAILAGALILKLAPMAALWLEPPAALLAAWSFWRVRHPFTAAPKAPKTAWREKLVGSAQGYLQDLREGARAILGDPRLRWFPIAMVLPAVVHRVFENVLLPVFAKKVLELPAASAWLLGASNFGELIGAVVLLRFAAHTRGPFAWLALAAAGLLGTWALSATASLPVLLPVIFLFALTWAASDLSLLSFLQSELPERTQPRALGFLLGLTTLVSTVAALTLGKWLDLAGTGAGFLGVNIAFTALALAVFWASRRLKR